MENIKISDLKNRLQDIKIDYFLTCASFENRSLFLLKELDLNKISNFVVFATTDFDNKIEINRNEILEVLKSRSTTTVDLKISDPVDSFINIVNHCSGFFSDKNVTILLDISTFTHEHLLILYRVLHDYKRLGDKILTIYTSVESYSHNIDDMHEKWLSKGVKELRSIIGFPGHFDPVKRNHLVILVGFELERVIRLIESFDFEMVTLIIGSKAESIGNANHTINEHRYDQIFNLYSNAKKLEISLTNPYEVKNTILKYLEDFREFNTVIAPMNNKISTLGVGFAAIDDIELQLFYMQANIYNIDGYSKPSETLFLGEM